MAISSRPNISFPLQDFCEGNLDHVSEDQLIYSIVKDFHPNRRVIASRQLKTYFKKISSHPHMRREYINRIKQLIQFEKTRGANSD